jgi:hypothetical protein
MATFASLDVDEIPHEKPFGMTRFKVGVLT